MPIIHAEIVAGRPWEKRQELIERLTAAAVDSLAVAPESVRVIVTEVQPHHWAIGGKPKSLPTA
ncbi:hypothetical protein CAF53_22795 [Sphingobium sp. LB126]|uniref:2-hydroxymuconate tautomerase family protein n=1 Tax=Sphingobium TaxID=165695 RepID=UPI000C2028C2|nr:2-hydroxymuconate tautomerase family protein [Sphingobium sp. LB126]PJG45563.1 hypothetical protein CAF53_22795 [Sphingobium sp. LB126]